MKIFEIQISEILRLGRHMLACMNDGSWVVKHGEFGSTTHDAELRADVELGNFYRGKLFGLSGVRWVSVEGQPDESLNGGEYWATVDPLDGSLNFKTKGKSLGLPFSSCITVLSHKCDASFSDVVAAGVIDLRLGDVWSAHRENNGYVSCMNGEKAVTARSEKLDLTQMVVIGEFYYPENRDRLCKAFAGKKGWLRNPGSAAYEMALIASGQAVAYICDRQKQHELGAAYALVKGAGGVAVDFDGKDLGSRMYDFKMQTPVVLAANQRIADEIVQLINNQKA